MADYPTGKGPAFDPLRAAERKTLVDRAGPIQAGDPAYRHLVDHRGIDAAVVLGHPDLQYLAGPIPGRPGTDAGALVALLRPGPKEAATGAELTFVDALGAKSAAEPARLTWSFVERGCSTAWFWGGGHGG